MKLSQFFERRFRKVYGGNARSITTAKLTVEQFIEFAGDIEPADLTDATLKQFRKHLRNGGASVAGARQKADRIRFICNEASPKPDRPPITKSSKLSLYLGEFFSFTSPVADTREVCTAAVAAFAEWYGSAPTLSEMSPQLVAEYEESIDKPYHRRFPGAIRTIMRTYDPAAWRQTRVKDEPEASKGQSKFHLRNVYHEQYEPRALCSRRPNTKRLYVNTLNQLDKFLEREATLDDLNDDTVNRFVAWIVETGRSKHTANKHIFNVCALWRRCARKGLVEVWPDVPLEQAPKHSPQAWTEDEMRRLFKAACEFPGMYGDIPAGDWWRALILVLWDSCERIGAAVNLKWSDVNLKTGWVRFDAENRKGGREDSDVLLGPDAIKALKAIRRENEDVFPLVLGLHTVLYLHFPRILEAAELPSDRYSKFHRVRRTTASYVEAQGGNATEMLRHTKREITKAYIDRKIVKRQQAKDYLFRLTAQ